jgi:hypothetical protein
MNSVRHCHIQSGAQSGQRKMLEKAFPNQPKAIAQAKTDAKHFAEILRASCTKNEERHTCLEDFPIPQEWIFLINLSHFVTTLASQAIPGHAATPAAWAARGPESRQAAPSNQEAIALQPRSDMLC